MRNYIILNGVNSNTITGLLISTLPPITKPKIRTQTEEIDGRDGDIVTKLGYSAYDKEIEIGLYGNFDINEVIAYFNTEGTVVFSNEADKYYNYQILDQIDYEKLIRFKTAKVKMHVQPFKYPLEETPVEINIQNVTGSGETTSLDNTAEAPLTLALKGNTSQDGTPTPEAPVEVQTVTGRQEINIVGKNLFDKNNANILNNTYLALSNNKIASTTGTKTLYIPIISGQTYTVSKIVTSRFAIATTSVIPAIDVTLIDQTQNNSASSLKITASSNAKYLCVFYLHSSDTIPEQDILNSIQIEKGSTATTYEPYQSQSYELDLGKNIINLTDRTATSSGITMDIEDGIITLNGTATANAFINAFNSNYFINLKAGTYTLSANNSVNAGGTSGQNVIRLMRANGSDIVSGSICQMNVINGKATFTITEDTECFLQIRTQSGTVYNNFVIKPQLERGDTASSFAPYKTPIEVNYIPDTDYRDYFFKDNNKWYIHKEIGRVVLNGSESWRTDGTLTNTMRYALNNTDITQNALCNSFVYLANYNNDTEHFYVTNTKALLIFISKTLASSLANFKIWLSTHNVEVYYVLEIPEDEEITDNTLIGQLNAIENARSYDTTTHINQNTANKPFIINATAVQKGSDTGNVDNIGNIYAKPTIDIEGSGIVEIYLDGNQIFNVDLSTINECVIDTTNLEAYNPATTQLMNRQVTGDYSNFKINVGDNQVKVSGAVTKATISNYTRWL